MLGNKKGKLIYLDHAATTPLNEEVVRAMQPYLYKKFGNASSIYELGMQAKFDIDTARKTIADILEARESEIVFTAGGTESVNLALFGVVRQVISSGIKKPHIIVSAIEHHAVLESAKALKDEGIELTILKVNNQGFVNPKDLAKAIKKNTVLISVIYSNNEIGTVQPINELVKVIRKENLKRKQKILFHTDACQASGVLDLSVNKLGVDLMTLNASKIYGPKQVGLLYIRTGIKLKPLIYGGGQERGLRSGTENTAGIIGFAKALEIAERLKKSENKRLRVLRNYLIINIQKTIPDAILNGPSVEKDSEKNILRLPNNINFSFVGVDGEALLLYLDAQGFAVSTGSACASTSLDPSHVLLAIGLNKYDAKASVRITLGRSTKKSDLDALVKVSAPIIKELRRVESINKKH
ncbi:MAG: cysteine desulfurase [Candidatus Doudnabacteria bacterium Gr01-1014_77]|uniref:Cysteine desulfurase n=1 Tax=Candidatus Doudnabacteria bacterium Gr01-1014_77 TaxID=2017133 RepID=A0A554JD30_9BACT|nr:MAG: cysteine desulfurase [Candidatus Doudnabacteria bacterium Gr01-1014_77]